MTRTSWRWCAWSWRWRGGFHVDATATGREVLALAQADPPDVILLDFNLPDLPAREAAHALGA